MKTLLALLFFGLISTSTIFAQESADVADEMNQFLSKNLRYPTEARSNGIQGTVILQATFDELGFPLTTTVISGDELLSAEVMRTISALTENWKPEYLGDRNKGESYLLSFQFNISKDRSPTQIHQIVPLKDQSLLAESDEKQLTSGLEANPYNFKLYEARAELYSTLNLPVLAEKDLILADYFQNKMLTQLVIVGYEVKDKSLSAVE
jgi:hypothetical protein